MSTPKTTARRTRVETGIYTRPDGSYEIGFRDATGKQRWRKVEGGIRAARAELAKAHAQRARGERIAVDPRLKFGDAAQAWWDARVVKLRPRTQDSYAAGLVHLKKAENFGRSRMTDITPTDVAKFVARQQAAGLKGWTIKGHLTVLSSVFKYASRHLGLAGANPVAALDSVERPSTADESAKRILNADELARFLSATLPRYRLLFELAGETGMRLSEVLGLAWGEVNLTEQTLTLTHQLDRDGRRQPLKTKRSRRVLEITPRLAAGLREHKRECGRLADHELVFTTSTGRGFQQRNLGRAMTKAVERAGLGQVVDAHGEVVVPAPSFHDLRHSHASALIAAGWDIAEVSARLGHASVVTTQRIYVHQFDAARRSDDRRDRLAALYAPTGAATPGGTEVIRLSS